ncbi:phage holin, lambda family [Pokkaliibacter plantistimulans]|uniref:Phage holin, lambda family n=1 Tax=Proteobacteria bacterium 228 TaxID=2083153 RepID=A0A2S5KT78_9PROT|nr:phage holin, lambda family [Pokkaliibacter plantistimulans]PPC77923.1 phage holin, lambda family [Pokkaliibacter plantistimulans]
MPEKEPQFWLAIWHALSTSPTWQGAVMAAVISVLRVLYDGKETKPVRLALEALISGALTLCSGSLIAWLGLPENVVMAVGGAIGFLGVATLRGLAIRWVGKQVGSDR